MHDVGPLLDLLRSLLPCELPGGELALADFDPHVQVDEAGMLLVVLRMVTREHGVIVELREQQVALGRFDAHSIARWQAYLAGTLRAAPVIVPALGGLDRLLPHELFEPRVLEDPQLVSADDFSARLTDVEVLARWQQRLEDEPWLELLEPCGLADRLAEVRAMLRPSLRLRLSALDEDESELEIGCSRFGGDPDLPRSLAWPQIDGAPLVFVAQLELAELAQYDAAAELPREGLLSCFYAPIPPERFGLEHPVVVLHLREVDVLERRAAPEPRERLRVHAIDFEEELLLPALESHYHYERLLPAADVRAFYESLARGHAERAPIDYSVLGARGAIRHAASLGLFAEGGVAESSQYPDTASFRLLALDENPGAMRRAGLHLGLLAQLVALRSGCDFERPTHRLLGHPDSIQGDPYLDVEMCQRGWDGWREGSDEAFASRERSLAWRLLLQVDAYQDEQLLLNQDGGFFYFWIPADALAVHDWTRVRGCLQCH